MDHTLRTDLHHRARPLPDLKDPVGGVAGHVQGDLGTKGSLHTDERAWVFREDGTVIEGMYAAGSASASVMGRSYAGAGATIGPAMMFGYIAIRATAVEGEAPA